MHPWFADISRPAIDSLLGYAFKNVSPAAGLTSHCLTASFPLAVGPDQLVVNEAVLRRAWESSQRSTPEDWAEWARHFAVELLRNSPSPALRANYRLAEVFYRLVVPGCPSGLIIQNMLRTAYDICCRVVQQWHVSSLSSDPFEACMEGGIWRSVVLSMTSGKARICHNLGAMS